MKKLLLCALLQTSCISGVAQGTKIVAIHIVSDCSDAVGIRAESAIRERIRASKGYSIDTSPTKGKSGTEVILTCAAIPGHERDASAVSYVFDKFLPDDARYFVLSGVGVVGVDGLQGWADSVFSQLDKWESLVESAASH
jgi:hypothetical protein